MGIGAWERGQAMEVPCTEASAEPGERSWTDAGVTPRTEKEDPKMETQTSQRDGGMRPRRRPGNRQRKKFQGQETSSFRCYRRPRGNERWSHWGNLDVTGVTFRKPFP